jgi:hypothetical protein
MLALLNGWPPLLRYHGIFGQVFFDPVSHLSPGIVYDCLPRPINANQIKG